MNKQKVNMTSSTKEKGYSSSSHYRISSEFETPYDFFFYICSRIALDTGMCDEKKLQNKSC